MLNASVCAVAPSDLQRDHLSGAPQPLRWGRGYPHAAACQTQLLAQPHMTSARHIIPYTGSESVFMLLPANSFCQVSMLGSTVQPDVQRTHHSLMLSSVVSPLGV